MESQTKTVEEFRIRDDNDPGREDLIQCNSTKQKRSRKRRNSGESQGSAQTLPFVQVPEERWDESESGMQSQSDRRPLDAQKQGVSPVQEDHKARFYDDYRKVAEEYDKEFIKKYDEDLNTTLIFAGLFSAVASAFIIQVDSRLQPDPGDETVALLRLLIYKIGNTTFGNDLPTLQQSTSLPPAMVHVQAILFSSLAASLLSAFLAMLGKQWLNRYASTDQRGSAVERSQNRQRKLDGVNKWYFDSMMELLPLMLQVALLLLGCALSRYLWGTSIVIALVVLCVTSFGLLFYFFILVVGTVWEDCPYQTPGSRFFRYMGPKIPRIVYLATLPFRRLTGTVVRNPGHYHSLRPGGNITAFLEDLVNRLPSPLVAVVRDLRAHSWFCGTSRTPEQGSDDQPTALDLRCISWTLQTSLDEPVRVSSLKHLVTITQFPTFDSTLIVVCFNIFVGCISVSDGKAVIVQGFEQLAALSSRCFFQTLRHLSATHPTPSVLADIRRRYSRIFPFDTDFRGLPFYQTAASIHVLACQRAENSGNFRWARYRLSNQEVVPFARCMVEAARGEYYRTQNKRVPCWILRFTLHFLSRNPPPPPSVIADCLTIIAISLDHEPSSIPISDESVQAERVSSLITERLEMMARVPDTDPIFGSKRKAISVLFPYATYLAQGGHHGMVDAISRVASKSTFRGFMWHHVERYFTTLFDESSPPSLNHAIAFASPFAHWGNRPYTQGAFARWVVAVLSTPYSEVVGASVVDALLQIASVGSLRPHIPIPIWAWLKRLPSLPPVCQGRYLGTSPNVVHHIQRLGDIGILKSYLLLVWSEWNTLGDSDVAAMKIVIRADFFGLTMWHHWKDLAERLEYVLDRLDWGLEYFKQYERLTEEHWIKQRKKQYGRLKKVLLEGRSATLPES